MSKFFVVSDPDRVENADLGSLDTLHESSGLTVKTHRPPDGFQKLDFERDTRTRIQLLAGSVTVIVGEDRVVLEPGKQIDIEPTTVFGISEVKSASYTILFGSDLR